jgi:ParB-like chromosome segregation protein Spo0J
MPHPSNPIVHPRSQIQKLARFIKRYGWRRPITISTTSGYIVRGHARLEAAKLIGVQHVPIDEQAYSSADAEIADLIADNRISDLGCVSYINLARAVEQLLASDVDIADIGMTDVDVAELLNLEPASTDTAQILPNINRTFRVRVDYDAYIRYSAIRRIFQTDEEFANALLRCYEAHR